MCCHGREVHLNFTQLLIDILFANRRTRVEREIIMFIANKWYLHYTGHAFFRTYHHYQHRASLRLTNRAQSKCVSDIADFPRDMYIENGWEWTGGFTNKPCCVSLHLRSKNALLRTFSRIMENVMNYYGKSRNYTIEIKTKILIKGFGRNINYRTIELKLLTRQYCSFYCCYRESWFY